MKTLSQVPVEYVPLGRPCISCDQWGWAGSIVSAPEGQTIEFQSCHCQKSHRSLDAGAVLNGVIPGWCPNILHIMIASGEQN